MHHPKSINRPATKIPSVVLGFLLCLAMPFLASSAPNEPKIAAKSMPTISAQPLSIDVIPPGSAYRQKNFVSDIPGFGLVLDPLLVNPWGIAMSASSPFWVANNGTSTTQILKAMCRELLSSLMPPCPQ